MKFLFKIFKDIIMRGERIIILSNNDKIIVRTPTNEWRKKVENGDRFILIEGRFISQNKENYEGKIYVNTNEILIVK